MLVRIWLCALICASYGFLQITGEYYNKNDFLHPIICKLLRNETIEILICASYFYKWQENITLKMIFYIPLFVIY